MNQNRDELVRGLAYVRDTMAKMQAIFLEYARLEKELREEKQAIKGSNIFSNILELAEGIFLLVTLAGTVACHDGFTTTLFVGLFILTCLGGKWHGFLKLLAYMIVAIGAIFPIMTGWYDYRQLMLTSLAVEVVVCLFVLKVINRKIASDNRKIAKHNQTVKEKQQELAAGYHQLENELKERTSSWYPLDYYNMEAAEFFFNAVRNHRADSVKEMVNLFETTAEHRKLLEFQKSQAMEQQRRQELRAQNQQAIQEQLRYADMMDGYARFFSKWAEHARQKQLDMKLRNIETSLWNIEHRS